MPRIVLALLFLVALLGGPPASAAPPLRAADDGQQGIGPGVQMFTEGAQCTGNFVFRDRRHRLYVGYAAHCAGTGEATDTDGCTTKSLARGTPVRFAVGASQLTDGTEVGNGKLVYSSWLTMQQIGTTDADTCAANDLALVRVDRADRDEVDPTVPHWGGPTGLATQGAPQGSSVYSWGQSSLRPDQTLSPRQGVSLGSANGGWGWDVYTATPGVPGDSGSGFLDAQGRALGVLSTVAVAPLPLSNGVGDLAHELAFARDHSGIRGLRLVRGTVPFAP
jgi:Trypsin-like peptidase domain